MRIKRICVLIHIRNKGGLVPSNMFKPPSNLLTDRSKAVLLLWIRFDICVSCLSFVIQYCLFLAAL